MCIYVYIYIVGPQHDTTIYIYVCVIMCTYMIQWPPTSTAPQHCCLLLFYVPATSNVVYRLVTARTHDDFILCAAPLGSQTISTLT